MMPTAVFVLILLILGLCRGSCGLKPLIRPAKDEIVINAGDTINFQCIHPSNIFFFSSEYNDQDGQKIVISRPEIKESEADGTYKYIFSRRNAVPSDTGWYGCADRNVTITPEIFNDTEFSWIYFYVSSPEQLFVEENVFKTVRKIAGQTAILPCRPTSPDLEVELYNEDTGQKVEIEGNISFDPKFGFKFNYLRMTDSNFFKCVTAMNGEEHDTTYNLHVLRNMIVNDPKIDETALKHVIEGQNLHVNCTIHIENGATFLLDWITPNKSSRISKQPYYMKDIGENTQEVIRELVIQNVTKKDEGEYECYIKTHTDTKSKKANLTVYDPRVKYLNLIPQDVVMNYKIPFGGKVTWVVKIDAYPEPEIKWFRPNGDTNAVENQYVIKTTPSSTSLTINHLHLKDMGQYQLVCTNDDNVKKSLNFTLEVLAKPLLILENIEAYYTPGQNAYIRCKVQAFPEPNITWTFLRCPHYPSMENSSLIELKTKEEELNFYTFLSETSMEIDVSGIINCTACNSIGCDYVSENVFVSDGNGDFDILEPMQQITEYDSISIVCAASIYNYTNNITWTKGDEIEPIVDNESMKIRKEKTQFTYRSILDIPKVRKGDADIYTCSAQTADEHFKRVSYNLSVNDQRPPVFKNSTLNGKDLSINLGKERFNPIALKCYVDGMPKPNVTWYKDGVPLNNTTTKDQYVFSNNNQELHIKYLLEKDSGKYTCRATNRLDTVEDFINIQIKGKELSKGLISMIVILFIVVVILVIYFTIKVRREKILRKELLETGLMHFEEGALECLNPDLTVDDQAELLPYDKKWEFPRDRLKLGKQLGSGAFGVVMKAEAQGICEDETVTTVAVKMVRRTTDPTYVRALASELKIMVHLGKHLNVVNLLGACTKNISKRELLVIVEYCRFGNLHNYLLRHRANFVNQIDPVTGKFDPMIGIDLLSRTMSVSSNRIKYAALSFSRSISANSETETIHYDTRNTSDSMGVTMSPDGCILSNNSSQPGWRSNYRGDYKDHNLKPICTQDLLSWAFQVARGMEYLSQRKVLHGDLAARNILLAEDNIVKICDFGLAKTMYKDDNYKKKGDGPLPIKWMAIESIRDRVFSTQSDIWSFGIVLWEFFTLAETPYPGMEAEKQYQKLIEGYRMEQPAYSTNEVYRIMLQCWKAKPTLRPSFTELVDSIGDLLEENVKAHYISLNTPYMDMNTLILEGKNDYLTMMSAPDHAALSSPTNDYMNSPNTDNVPESAYLCMSPSNPREESGIFSPRPNPEKSRFEFPSVTSDSEDAVEISPMLKNEDDPYLKPINVHERRIEFARQRQAAKELEIDPCNDRDSGYSNTPRNLHLIDLNVKQTDVDDPEEEQNRTENSSNTKLYAPNIIRTPDNYVNMPKQKSDLRRDMPDGFSNPSYIMMGNSEANDMKV